MSEIALSITGSKEGFGRETSRTMIIGRMRTPTDDILIAMSAPLSSVLLGTLLAAADDLRARSELAPSPPAEDGMACPTPDNQLSKLEYQLEARLIVRDWPKPYRETHETLAEAKLSIVIMVTAAPPDAFLAASLDTIGTAALPLLRRFFTANDLLLPSPMPLIGKDAELLADLAQETVNAQDVSERITEAIEARDYATSAAERAQALLADAVARQKAAAEQLEQAGEPADEG